MDPGAPEAWGFSPGMECFGKERKEGGAVPATESKDSDL